VAQISLVAALLGACAAAPWVVPQIPGLFAKTVPDKVVAPKETDPTVAPPAQDTASISALPGIEGTRLAAAGVPLEVVVRRLHVDSQVVPISTDAGELVPPSDPQLLGWWQEGRRAGSATGSTVITGHTVSVGGGAFDHLGELVPGDKIRVRTAAGQILYVVRESTKVSVKQLARRSQEIFDQGDDGRLVLITCSDFNGSVYLSNSVVFAAPVKDIPRDAQGR
jgi:LPXTG-site transpeptidase (sortase) family protein